MERETFPMLEDYINKISNLRVWKRSNQKRPHKYILILSLIQLLENDNSHKNKFSFKELEEIFEKIWKEYSSPLYGTDEGLLEHPYYHLISDGFWHHEIKKGAEFTYKKYKESREPKYRFTKQRIIETIEYAYLDDDLYNLVLNPENRERFKQVIVDHISNQANSVSKTADTKSLFKHESIAIETIDRTLLNYNLGKSINNFLIYDEQTNNYYECDLIVVTYSGIYVVELKHWTGHIRIAPYNWIKNGVSFRRDPHGSNLFKAKLLKGAYQHYFRTYPNIWVESVVVFTNPDAIIENASPHRTDKHCPTFESIECFIDYLRHQKRPENIKLKDQQIDQVINYLESLKQPRIEREYSLPGYEVLDHLTQRNDLIEFIARPTDGRYRTLKRFRIFLSPPKAEPIDKERFNIRARNTLDAVSKIGDNPNILKVWSVPDESGLLIEGSDWSEQGTLKDLIDSHDGPFDINEALAICEGLLNALAAAHKEDVIHRAIKTENILMVNSIPKLMNFDISYQLENGDHITVIPDATVLKRDAYTAPEVYRCEDLDESTDLFSIGVILFELLTGERPFKVSTDLENMGGRLTQDAFQKLKKRDISHNICDAIDKLICSKREERIKHAEDVITALNINKKHLEIVNRKLEADESYDVYTIERLIGKGTESQVYYARTIGDQRIVLKVFNRDVPITRILNEEKAASAVHSPYLVHAKRAGYWNNDRYFLELNFIDGRRMRNDIISKKLPTTEEFKAVTSCLLRALNTLHHHRIENEESPILHSDIKPDNVMLTLDGGAVLIDFGIADSPRVDSYQGTEGYVAPDLAMGGDIQFCQDGDLFALGITLFEWLYGKYPYERLYLNAEPVDTKEIRNDVSQPLRQWLRKAIHTVSENRFQNIDEMEDAFQASLKEMVIVPDIETMEFVEEEVTDIALPEPILAFPCGLDEGNPFVTYLNSLHNATGNNENALAESQAVNPFFGYIHIPLEVTNYIYERLTGEERGHVILTGHAGDGKTIIGLELFKRLKNIPHEQPLEHPILPIEEIANGNYSIVLVKDMSELAEEDRKALLLNACEDNEKRFFIISNTGTLLNAFEQITDNKSEWRELQNKLLHALENSNPDNIEYRNSRFNLINLVRVDNIETACRVFERMLNPDRWKVCDTKECCEKCPIYNNIDMLWKNWEIVHRRVELVYRRLYEYGSRLTLRQMTGHLAYAITAGLDYDNIIRLSGKALRPPLRRFLFFNRFFGDCGDIPDSTADQLKAILDIRSLEAGKRSHPGLDRQIWRQEVKGNFFFEGGALRLIYEHLRSIGGKQKHDETLSPSLARMQMRRLLYCYGQFESSEDEKRFISIFLDSPMLVNYARWQISSDDMSFLARRQLRRNVLHVLQEHFTGIRLPENAGSQDTIYVTLNRRNFDVRQTAQIVLGKYQADNFEIVLDPLDSEICGRRYQLKLIEKKSDNALDLELPFLDFVTNRHHGEVAQQLQSFYADRLERFKVGLLGSMSDEMEQKMMLVRLQLNHAFKSQVFSIHDGVLEVIQ